MKPFPFVFMLAGVVSAVTLDELIPGLADPVVTNRYAAQVQLEVLAADAAKPGNEAARVALSKQLAAKVVDPAVPQPARVWIVRQLELMGRGEVVPSLCKLLEDGDAELRECARRALERNPDAKAADCLRGALQRATDPVWKIGLVHSLGRRRDPRAASLIVPLLGDAQVGGAAARALGEIATSEAVRALWRVFDSQPAAVEALCEAAVRLRSDSIARELYRRSKASHVRAAALSVLGGRDRRLLEEALLGEDVRLQKAAVDVSTPAVLVALLPRMPASAKVFALRVVDSERAVLECFGDPDESVRVAALEAMARVGTASSVPALIRASVSGTEAERAAANDSLATINGRGAAEAIERQAQDGESAARVAAIQALSARVAKHTVPALLRYAAEADAAVSRAALSAVARLGGDESLEPLVSLVISGRAGAKEALHTVAGRSANKAGLARKLAAQLQKVAGEQVGEILEVLAVLGGAEALSNVVKFARSDSEEVKDRAVRALSQWRDFE
ncbi:MAG: HEAT repeat domain-containing protein, partial [Verrucomicrobiae bacterium]|nr:HEAT repeat domain-containing protein [Verrucomicrobiae bacterium]